MPEKATSLLLAVVFCLAVPCAAKAASQVFRIGDMKIHTIIDAATEGSPKGILVGIDDARLAELVPSGKVERTILAFLVEFPTRTVLFDTGLGKAAGGKALDSLKEAGFAPSDIGEIIITHLHGDHFGGLIDNGKPVFPNATVFLARNEFEWWLSREREFDAYAKGSERAREALYAYPGRVAVFEFGREVLPGIAAVDARGHTAGHTVFELDSGGERFLIVSDLMHFADVQFALPDVTVTYDTDQPRAAAARRRILKLAADQQLPIAGMHLPLPGIWRVEVDGDGFKKIAY